MSCVVRTLALRCPTAQRETAQWQLEDAIRTAIPDDGRLWLIRRLQVGPAPPHDRRQRLDARVGAGWQRAIGTARHAAAGDAESANCVWFASRHEAEALLLARLLRGQRVDGWFWRLALPDWGGRGARDWLATSLAAALTARDDRRLLLIARQCVDAEAEPLLLAVIGDPLPRALAGQAAFPLPPPAARQNSVADAVPPGTAPHALAADAAPPQLPPRLAALVSAILGMAGSQGVAAAIVRQWLLGSSPALGLAPAMLAAQVARCLAAVSVPRLARPPTSRAPASRPPLVTPTPPGAATTDDASQSAPDPMVRDVPCRALDSRAADLSRAPRPTAAATVSAPPSAPPMPDMPVASRHAGLWLVLPSLQRLGFDLWLADQPALLADHPGRQLMVALARHHRIAAADPLLAALGPVDDAALPEWALMWAHALDRWLRHSALRRVHDLAARPGRLLWSEYRLDVHFPAHAADLALRRRALDRDPGWTPWLGLTVRYHFGDGGGWP